MPCRLFCKRRLFHISFSIFFQNCSPDLEFFFSGTVVFCKYCLKTLCSLRCYCQICIGKQTEGLFLHQFIGDFVFMDAGPALSVIYCRHMRDISLSRKIPVRINRYCPLIFRHRIIKFHFGKSCFFQSFFQFSLCKCSLILIMDSTGKEV